MAAKVVLLAAVSEEEPVLVKFCGVMLGAREKGKEKTKTKKKREGRIT